MAVFASLAALATILAAPAGAATLDRAYRTPVAHSASATASSPVSRSRLCAGLATRARRGGSASGVYVIDTSTGKRVCGSHGRTRRIPASNMKLFTTATALARFGADGRLKTTLWRSGTVDAAGVLHGNLFLVGGGDPALSSPSFGSRFLGPAASNLFELSDDLESAGISKVTGKLYADDTVFDRLRGVADSGYATSPYIGPLSGLDFNSGYADSGAHGFAKDPAIVAADALADSLRATGVSISANVTLGAKPASGTTQVGEVDSPKMPVLTNETDVFSNNFFAEMLVKDLGAYYGSAGTTRAGTVVVKRFARSLGSGVRAVDGSGLTRRNRVSPAQVARLLSAMRKTAVADEFAESLPIAGKEGTVAQRMRGTAAAGRCSTKTGTISGVSALSGYCFNADGKVMAFSILNNRVSNLYEAHRQQDRMAALIARY